MDERVKTLKRRRRVKLIFNPMSGSVRQSPDQLMNIIEQLQAWKLMPEVYLLQPDSDISRMVDETLANGITMFVACGGDGTVSAIAKSLAEVTAAGSVSVTLGIIPTGTQNNIALSLGIPADIPSSISILRTGRRKKIDLGMISCDGKQTYFIELCSVGLTSSIFSSADEIQHGHLDKIGDFLSTLVSSEPSEINLLVNNTERLTSTGHVVIVANMPYTGRHFQVGNLHAFQDGLLDVLFLGDLSKLKLLGYALGKHAAHELDDPRIQTFQAHSIDISTTPSMPIMADGVMLGNGNTHIGIKKRCLGVMTAEPAKQEVNDYELLCSRDPSILPTGT